MLTTSLRGNIFNGEEYDLQLPPPTGLFQCIGVTLCGHCEDMTHENLIVYFMITAA